jgi:hypothetical protein
MVELCFWPSIVLLHKLAIYCNYIWYILCTMDFYVLGLRKSEKTGSYYLSMHSWPAPPIFLPIVIFLCRFVPPFWVSLSVLCARKLLLLKSLFLDKNLNQIDLIIPTLIIFILRDASSIGWVAVAVVVASVMLAVQKALHRHHLIRVSCLFGSDPKFTRCQ